MAAKKGKSKPQPKAQKPKKATAKPAPRAATPAKPKPKPKPAKAKAVVRKGPTKTAPAAQKRASIPRGKPEPPPIDHAATIGPLYLGAGHGHLARSVDKGWIEALERYRRAVDDAVAYEAKRSAVARSGMVLTFARQVQQMMNNLAARVQAILSEVQSGAASEAQREAGRQGGGLLVAELKRLNETYGALVGPNGIAPLGDEALAPGVQPQLEQLQRAYFNNIARWADLERALR